MDEQKSPHDHEFIVVYSAFNVTEAHIVAGRLQSEGIRAWVHQEPAGSALGINVGILGEVRVLVRDDDYEAAIRILEDDDTQPLLDYSDQDEADDDDHE
jgi:hypothetical protein